MSRGGYLGEFEMVVLLALARLEDAAYGMAIYDEIVATTGRDVSIQAVYVTLSRLEKKELVTSSVGGSEVQAVGRAKKYYKLLDSGLDALRQSRVMYDSLWSGVRLDTRAASHESR